MSAADRDPVLALPDGWLLADLARERLVRALAAQGPDVAGVVARADQAPAGGSYLSHAERMAIRPEHDLVVATGRQVAGAVLMRAGVDHEVDANSVTVGDGRLLVDRGAVAFDPWAGPPPLEDASPDGRSPFPYRPVVLLIGLEHDVLLADWGRATVNGLIRAGCGGRLAVPAPTEGLHLTTPCRPSAPSVRALEPDVVVALDHEALDRATSWLDDAGNRSTVTVLLTPGTETEPELVSWRIGDSRGRLRARIGRGVKSYVLADLVRRLATGPVPVGPLDRAPRPDGQRLLNPRRALNRAPKGPLLSLQALVDSSSPDTYRRFEVIFGHFAPPTHTSVEPLSDRPTPSSTIADVLVVSDPRPTPTTSDLVRARSAAGLSTIIDVTADRPSSPEQDDLIRMAGLAITTDDVQRDRLIADLGVRAFTLPDLLPGRRATELAASGEEAARAGRSTIGCDVRDTSHDVQEAVREALLATLDRCPELRCTLVASDPGPLTDIVRREDTTLTTTSARPSEQSGWIASLVTSDLAPARRGVGLVESQLVGVPVVCPSHHPAAREGLVTPSLTVTDPADSGAWTRVLDELLHGPGMWERRSVDARALALALYGPASTAALLDRFVGWFHFGART